MSKPHWKLESGPLKIPKRRNLVKWLKQRKCNLVIKAGAGLPGGLSGKFYSWLYHRLPVRLSRNLRAR